MKARNLLLIVVLVASLSLVATSVFAEKSDQSDYKSRKEQMKADHKADKQALKESKKAIMQYMREIMSQRLPKTQLQLPQLKGRAA